jgi:hypothetical protein
VAARFEGFNMQAQDTIELSVKIARKQEDLPRFVVIASSLVAPWDLAGTETVELTLNGVAVGRRSIRRWDERRWFISITAEDCRRTGVDTGSTVALTMRRASTDLPAELAALLQANPRAKDAWRRLSSGQQRMLREEIQSARRASTRTRRARKALLE